MTTTLPETVAEEFGEYVNMVDRALVQLDTIPVKVSSAALRAECKHVKQLLMVADPSQRYSFNQQTDLIDRALSVVGRVDHLVSTN